MKGKSGLNAEASSPKQAPPLSKDHKAALHRQLEKILNSHAFRTSKRSQEFLSYVVGHTLEGDTAPLKERTIGVDLFDRPADYATGEDGVVRVQAGEVRKRLAQFYHEQGNSSSVRIELPVGSYIPEFRWNAAAARAELPIPPLAKSRRKLWLVPTIAVLGLAGLLATLRLHFGKSSESPLNQFWSPIFGTSQAVLICLAKPVVYRPSQDVYRRFAKAHPDAFQTNVERYNKLLPLNPSEPLRWGDMVPVPAFGVAAGDVYAATRISGLFGRINKPCQVRIGSDLSFEDIRNSPTVLVGAFNNPWTLQLTSDLHFVFTEDIESDRIWIEDRTASRRVWGMRVGSQDHVLEDFGVITRVLKSKTGHVLIAVAGIGVDGTEAAGEFISTPDSFAEGMRSAPAGWDKKNMQIVVETTVTDSVPGPPHVVANYFW
ncbi:MAG: hypothetical protein WAO35_29365 [Terriglobia bacterium]